MSAQADDRIAAAIIAAESKTAAEIVVAVLPRAEPYRVTALLAAFAIVAVGAAGVPLFLPHALALYGYAGVALLGLAVYLLCEHSAVGIWLTPPQIRRRACFARARLAFLAHGIDATTDRLGLLVLVSTAERHIEILPDRGIADVIAADRWATLIAGFTAQIGKAGLEASLTDLIGAIGGELAAHFPPRPGQTNDLPDRPLRD